MAEYTSHTRARHGDDFDPATEPLDTEILMRAGGGKQHGRYYMAHSAIVPTTVPTLRQVRQASSTTSSDVPIRARQPSFQSQLAELRARQDSAEEAHQQEIARQNEAHRQELARQFKAFQQHQQRQMQDFANYFTSLQIPGVVTAPLPASLFAPLPPPGTVVQSLAQSHRSNPTPQDGASLGHGCQVQQTPQ
ncbi:uncharacterized protein LOC110432471 [Sorghum bicolor]|uniref:uncharacterized protein LOC110432471 n=1 Tax=Sorghum bicolor TaxID=4558 RepID=UPI000B425D28|nr:uncharacterized protein LOC110432471 [Sorghum bicolor]XP_021308630.1 uncharacterized protein LOC110432471 [Sorghum bicolor]XP_021308631.1 uncharacterized protein LOC110432471 [Sorghum bicolor]|eukprot:XP_021308629.1 uncharacterized protein LOC110432471 [Sorghum bicolor]